MKCTASLDNVIRKYLFCILVSKLPCAFLTFQAKFGIVRMFFIML